MKKLFSIIAVAIVATSFVACGPSAEEKAKMEADAQRIADSAKAAIEASISSAVETPAVDSAAVATETAPAEEAKH